jgi:peptide/nickel transport system substrate-binding protein
MDVRNTASRPPALPNRSSRRLAQAGIKMEIIPGDGKQTLTKYRARNHDIYIGQWGQDYFDPNSNAETFTVEPGQFRRRQVKTLAWRNAWDIPDLTKETEGCPAREGCRQARRHV